ncbi:MAG: hypothetical protein H0U29_01495 [Acidimicrobiia bacterium]|nr:hypothetical protein [Acidimicrobiia bacterium]
MSSVSTRRYVPGQGEGEGEDGDNLEPAETTTVGKAADGRSPRLVTAGLTLIMAFPLIVALAVLRQPRWFPILDLAMTELRIRDVGTANTPLIGLPGRIGVLGQDHGSHPGPLSFWLLAPAYRLFGSTAWASEVATVVLHTAAVATSLWLARRRGGTILVLGTAAVLATLARSYGAEVLTQPWNPYMPVLWWFVLLMAVWSLTSRDIVALPIAVLAASFCAQTHVPYLGLVAGLGVVAAIGVGDHYRRADPVTRHRLRRWVLGSAALGGLLWLAPVIDQVTEDPANGTLLVEHFGNPSEEAVGLRRGAEMVLLHLDPWRLFTEQGADTGSLAEASQAPTGSVLPGLALLAIWAVTVVLAWRLRHQALIRLHLVIAAGLALAVLSISRIFGPLWYYLMMWAWGITSLLILAVVWSVGAHLLRRADAPPSRTLVRAGAGTLVSVIILTSVVFTVTASKVEQPAPELSDTMQALVPPVVDVLSDGDAPGQGRDETYLVVWSDAIHIGSQGIALVNELERADFDVGVIKPWSTPVARHRRRDPADATTLVVLATGINIERWRAKPDAEEIAYVDLRTPQVRTEFERVRGSVIDELRAVGLIDLAAGVDTNLFAAAIDGRVPEAAQDGMTRLLDLGEPTAVFIGPVSMMD